MDNILILGGTGAMGVHLVKILDEQNNFNIYVTTRGDHSDTGNVRYIKGNAHDMGFITSLLGRVKWDAIVDFMVYSTDEFSERATTLLNATDQYIFLSSSRVYADNKGRITENSPRLLDVSNDLAFLRSDDYPLTKARQEDILTSSGKHNWTIIRPYITFSEQRLQLGVYEKEYWLYRALKNKTIVFAKDIVEKYTTLTYGYDVANGISKLIGNEKAYGEAFHITGEKALKWKDILEIYRNILVENGYDAKIYLSDSPDVVSISIGSNWPVTYDRLYNRIFDNKKFLDAVGENFVFHDPEQYLGQCLKEFLSSGKKFKTIPVDAQAYFDRLTHEHTPIDCTLKDRARYIIYRNSGLFQKRVVHKMRDNGQTMQQ